MAIVDVSIDYLRIVWSDTNAIPAHILDWFADNNSERSIPLYGYGVALKNTRTGAILLSQGHIQTMGTCIQMGGKAIDTIESDYGESILDVVRFGGAYSGRVTRLDCALDSFGGVADVYVARELIREGRFVSRSRKISVVEAGSGRGGMTVYVGAAESSTRLRIYDKSAEQGLGAGWTRYEAVLTDDKAQRAWEYLSFQCDEAARSKFIKGVIRDTCDFPEWAQFSLIVADSTEVSWAIQERPIPASWKWLTEAVSPTFIKARNADGDWRLLEQFVDYVIDGDIER